MTEPLDALVERLREEVETAKPRSFSKRAIEVNLMDEAADKLIAQREQLARMREALEPFATLGRLLEGPFEPALFPASDPIRDLPWTENGTPYTIRYGDLVRARAALANPSPEQGEKK